MYFLSVSFPLRQVTTRQTTTNDQADLGAVGVELNGSELKAVASGKAAGVIELLMCRGRAALKVN